MPAIIKNRGTKYAMEIVFQDEGVDMLMLLLAGASFPITAEDYVKRALAMAVTYDARKPIEQAEAIINAFVTVTRR